MAVDPITGAPVMTTMPVDPAVTSRTGQAVTQPGLVSAPSPDQMMYPTSGTAPVMQPADATAGGLMSAPATPPATATTPATSAPTSTTPNAPVYGAPTTQGWNVTDQQTVEGRIKGLIDANSPLMQQAATTGLQKANALGLANSSMAVGASQAEMLKAAVPIATSDANIQANAAQFNAIDPNKQLAIKADMDKFVAQIAANKDLSQADIAAKKDQLLTELASRENISAADRDALSKRLDTELASRERISTMENDARIKMSGQDNAYKLLVSNNQGAAGLYDTYQKAVQMINSNDKLDVVNKQKALNDQFAVLQSGLKMYQDTDALNLDAIVDPKATSGTSGTDGGGGGGATPPPDSAGYVGSGADHDLHMALGTGGLSQTVPGPAQAASDQASKIFGGLF